jgi:hypothetical protein
MCKALPPVLCPRKGNHKCVHRANLCYVAPVTDHLLSTSAGVDGLANSFEASLHMPDVGGDVGRFHLELDLHLVFFCSFLQKTQKNPCVWSMTSVCVKHDLHLASW